MSAASAECGPFDLLCRLVSCLCFGGLCVVACAVNLCVVFEQQVAKLTFGGELFESLVAVRAFVAVWIVMNKGGVYPDGRASFFVRCELL